jgi:DNA adenine methylase
VRLVEPFVGGAAFFLWFRPRRALLADLNEDLVSLYGVVRDPATRRSLAAELDELARLPHHERTFYRVRQEFNEDARERCHSSVWRAARFIYLNKNCFNGLYRVNRAGDFNVPCGRYAPKPTLYDATNLEVVGGLLSHAEVEVLRFEETLLRARQGDFVYLDPPYHPVSKTSSFTAYSKHAFGFEEQRSLMLSLASVHARYGGAVPFLLSNSVAPDLVRLYQDYRDEAGRPVFFIREVQAPRSISADGRGRGSIAELLVANYPLG